VCFALLVLLLAGAGCGSGAAEDPRRLSIALAEDPDELDPTISSTFVARIVFAHMCEKLYDVDDDLGIVPQLAAGMPQVSGDGRTVTIRVRDGIRFNDGTRFDAAAVKQSLDRHRTLEASSRSGELAPVTSVEVVDDRTVRLHLESPFAPLTSLLADRSGMVMSPRQLDRLGDKFATDPVCVGPFAFADRVASDRIVLERSEHYYDADRVQLDQITLRIITEGPVRASNLRSGDVDVAERLEPVDVVSIKGDPSIKLDEKTSIGYQGLTINTANRDGVGEPYRTLDTPLAKHPELREALDLAIDREVINKVVYFDQYEAGCGPISPVSRWADRSLRCPGRDLARAKRLVEQSGVKTPVPVTLMIEASSNGARLGEVIQAMAREAGFAVKVQPTEFTTGLDRGDTGEFDTFQVGWSGRVDPDGNIFNQQHTDGPTNYGGNSSPEVDAVLEEGRQERDPAKRREIYRRAVSLLRERRGILYLFHEKLFTGARPYVQGLEVRPDGLPRAAFASKDGG
jgi:peptide/nickel transport system substrate-binding protein